MGALLKLSPHVTVIESEVSDLSESSSKKTNLINLSKILIIQGTAYYYKPIDTYVS